MKNKILLKRQNGEYLSDPDSLEWGHVSVAYNFLSLDFLREWVQSHRILLAKDLAILDDWQAQIVKPS